MKALLIDGNSLLNRAFYALPVLTTKGGEYTNAVYGFLNMFFSVAESEKPTHVAVAFDRREPTFRHFDYKEYKAGRKPMPEELVPQLPLLKEALDVLGIPALDLAGFEADDLLGTLAAAFEKEGAEVIVLTGDKDALQLISPLVTVFITKRGISELERFTPDYLMEKMNLAPAQIVDMKALMGDASDNIPGIPGVGEKTALKLLAQFGTVEKVLENAEGIPGKLSEKVAAGAESARLSYGLATIKKDAPVQFCPENYLYTTPTGESMAPLFTRLEFTSFLKRFSLAASLAGEKAMAPAALYKEVSHPGEIALGRETAFYYQSEAPESFTFFSEGKGFLLPVARDMLSEGMPFDDALEACARLLRGKRVSAADGKQALALFGGAPLFSVAFDAFLAAYLLNPAAGKYSLEKLGLQYGLQSTGAALCAELETVLRQDLAENGMADLYESMELPLVPLLYEMEQLGFAADGAVLEKMGAELSEKIDGITRGVHEMAGEPINLNSPKQLGEWLFEKCGLPHGKKTKTGYSTDVDVLENLLGKHPAIPLLLEYRQAAKFKSTYVESLLSLLKKGRIHTTLSQTSTVTGRISSLEPNLQNIPVRSDYGRLFRKAFVAGEGCVLVDADYSQIDLRVLAHLSQDKALVAAFLSGEDIHTATAAEVFGLPRAQVTDAQRSAAKAVNFGIVYGISDFGLARQLGISRAQAGEYIEKYLGHYEGVKEYLKNSVESAREKGYAETLFGRRRPMPELKSSNYNIRSFGERAAMNTPVQGTSADILKLAMLRADAAFKKENLSCRLVLQVHDELLAECPEGEKELCARLLQQAMEGVAALRVPLIAKVQTGPSWFDTK